MAGAEVSGSEQGWRPMQVVGVLDMFASTRGKAGAGTGRGERGWQKARRGKAIRRVLGGRHGEGGERHAGGEGCRIVCEEGGRRVGSGGNTCCGASLGRRRGCQVMIWRESYENLII